MGGVCVILKPNIHGLGGEDQKIVGSSLFFWAYLNVSLNSEHFIELLTTHHKFEKKKAKLWQARMGPHTSPNFLSFENLVSSHFAPFRVAFSSICGGTTKSTCSMGMTTLHTLGNNPQKLRGRALLHYDSIGAGVVDVQLHHKFENQRGFILTALEACGQDLWHQRAAMGCLSTISETLLWVTR